MKIQTKQKFSSEVLEVLEDNMWFLTALVCTFSAISAIWMIAYFTISILN